MFVFFFFFFLSQHALASLQSCVYKSASSQHEASQRHQMICCYLYDICAIYMGPSFSQIQKCLIADVHLSYSFYPTLNFPTVNTSATDLQIAGHRLVSGKLSLIHVVWILLKAAKFLTITEINWGNMTVGSWVVLVLKISSLYPELTLWSPYSDSVV